MNQSKVEDSNVSMKDTHQSSRHTSVAPLVYRQKVKLTKPHWEHHSFFSKLIKTINQSILKSNQESKHKQNQSKSTLFAFLASLVIRGSKLISKKNKVSRKSVKTHWPQVNKQSQVQVKKGALIWLLITSQKHINLLIFSSCCCWSASQIARQAGNTKAYWGCGISATTTCVHS